MLKSSIRKELPAGAGEELDDWDKEIGEDFILFILPSYLYFSNFAHIPPKVSF